MCKMEVHLEVHWTMLIHARTISKLFFAFWIHIKKKTKLLLKSQCICFTYVANKNLQDSAKAI